jgi:Ca-activated chloride channel homolog
MRLIKSCITNIRPALFLALVLFFGTVCAVGQDLKDLPPPPPPPTPKPTPTPRPPSDEDFEIVRVSSNLVMVPVSVVDAKGQPVHGLQVSDFRIEEEGRQQEIAQIGDPDQVPLDIALLFDVSSSVSQKGFFAFQQKAAASFLKEVLKPVDRAAIFTIQEQPRLVEPLASAETAATKLLTIPAATSPVPTAFYDTVVAAAKYLIENSPERRRRVIVVISDGDDNFSNSLRDVAIAERIDSDAATSKKGETAAEPSKVRAVRNEQLSSAARRKNTQERYRRAVVEVQRAVQQADAAFYSINPGGPSIHLNEISTRAQNSMESIAEATGGTAFVPDSENDLERVFREVAAELRGQYLLQYYSNSKSPAAAFRRIAVAVPTHPELRVRARQGYYPKASNKVTSNK